MENMTVLITWAAITLTIYAVWEYWYVTRKVMHGKNLAGFCLRDFLDFLADNSVLFSASAVLAISATCMAKLIQETNWAAWFTQHTKGLLITLIVICSITAIIGTKYAIYHYATTRRKKR